MNNISILIVVTLLLILSLFNTMTIKNINDINRAQSETIQTLIDIDNLHSASISKLATIK